jgi:hypothetical protein
MVSVIKTPVGTLSYPNFYLPRERVQSKGEKVFSGVLLFTMQQTKSEQWKEMMQVIDALVRLSFPKLILGKGVRSPIRRCDEKDDNSFPDEYVFFLNAWSKQKPGVVDAALNDILDSSGVWPGQLARFAITPFAYDKQGNKGVSFALENVQIVKSEGMKRLDGRKSAADRFDDNELGDYDDKV